MDAAVYWVISFKMGNGEQVPDGLDEVLSSI